MKVIRTIICQDLGSINFVII